MREISSLELFKISTELSVLEGSYLRKFYEIASDEFEFVFHKDEQHYIYARLLKTINLTKFVSEHEGATTFAMQIRKRLENKRLEKIYQYGSDRILVFEFQEYKLIFEMFAKGNLILVDNKMTIIVPYKRVDYRDRKIDYKEIYLFPASKGAATSNEKIISFLSKKFDIGPIYIENVVLKQGIVPSCKIGSIGEEKMKEIEKEIDELKSEAIKSRPLLYVKEQEYSLFPLIKYKNSETRRYDTLSALLDDFYISERGKEEDKEGKKLEAIRKSIEQQREMIKKLEEDEKTSKEIAEKIMYNINNINLLLDYARKNKKASIEELNDAVPGIKIISIDLKNKMIKVEVE
ncbi:MAG: NFACT family protein [Candidatus Micrarchaeia archaeon]